MIETHSYTDFSVAVHTKTMPDRVPVNGIIEVTHRCPLECAHCYNNLPMSDTGARRREMTTEEHMRLLDELAEMGCLWLCYSGGEIFARHDFLDIYTYAKEKGMLLTLFTNGTMITERIADFLAENPPFSIEITLYGRTKATYEALTGIPGSFELCMRGIRLLMERDMPLKLKTVAVTINKHEVKAMQRFAKELGVEFKFDSLMNPRIDCSGAPLEVRLTPVEVVAMDIDDPERIAAWRGLAKLGADASVPGESRHLYQCGGGVNTFAIDPYGDLSICVLSHNDRYNVRDGSMREGWDMFLRTVRERRITRVTKCTTCPLTSLCGSCAAFGELENKDPEEPVDFLCRTSHLRADIFGVDIRPHGDCEYCPDGSHRAEIDAMAYEVRTHGKDIAMAIAAVPPRDASAGCGTGACNSCSVH